MPVDCTNVYKHISTTNCSWNNCIGSILKMRFLKLTTLNSRSIDISFRAMRQFENSSMISILIIYNRIWETLTPAMVARLFAPANSNTFSDSAKDVILLFNSIQNLSYSLLPCPLSSCPLRISTRTNGLSNPVDSPPQLLPPPPP